MVDAIEHAPQRATSSLGCEQFGHDRIVTYPPPAGGSPDGHDACTRNTIAGRLATLMGVPYAGDHDADALYPTPPYFIPGATLTSADAQRLSIRSERDLFGGVVPHAFVATKTITHPLVDLDAHAPTGWCPAFPSEVAAVVLAGYSAFSRQDALNAGRLLLARGTARMKRARGVAGLGQAEAPDIRSLEQALDMVDADEMADAGVVIEQHLFDVRTLSVGQVRMGDFVGTYHGTQSLTTNSHGAEVYGGSEITMVRGDFDALLALVLSPEVRLAVMQARVYDAAAARCFAGFYASRRNYDVAQGRDASGHVHSGVLEQSWRLGGASGAEVCALETLSADPRLNAVHAIGREVYGNAPLLPDNAITFFSGVDPRVGPLTKYSWVEAHADTR